MQRRTIDPLFKEEIRAAYFRTESVAARKRIIEEALKASGYSYGGLMRVLNLKVRSRSLCNKEQVKISEMNMLAMKVWDYQLELSHGMRSVSTLLALRKLKDDGIVPESVTYFQISQAIRRQNLKYKSESHFTRFQRTEPLAMVQMDFTRSVYLEHVIKEGKSFLRVTRQKGANAKRERVWIAVAIDDASRVCYARYYLVKGESSALAQHFLLKTCRPKGRIDKTSGEIIPLPLLQGQPKQLYTDRGKAFKNTSFENGLLKLDIHYIPGANRIDTEGRKRKASNKQARGKVERMIQFIKQNFETKLFIDYGEGMIFSKQEINALLLKWLMRVNSSAHPNLGTKRWDLFLQGLKSAVYPPDEAELLFSNSVIRTVQRRQIRVAEGVYCKVPPSVKKGEKIEILFAGGNHYCLLNGERILLEVITERTSDDKQSAVQEKKEFDLDYLEGIALRSRLNQEIETRTRQSRDLGILSENFPDEIEEFTSLRRSIKELKAFTTSLLLQAEKSTAFSVGPKGNLINAEK